MHYIDSQHYNLHLFFLFVFFILHGSSNFSRLLGTLGWEQVGRHINVSHHGHGTKAAAITLNV